MAQTGERLTRGTAMSRWAIPLTFLAVLLSSPVLGHGDAQWIADDPRFSYCCGIHDCSPAPESEVREVPGGWYLPSTGQTFLEGSPDLHVSRDHRPWWCKPPSWNGWVKCLFVAARGS
jgi:hypothetical protein